MSVIEISTDLSWKDVMGSRDQKPAVQPKGIFEMQGRVKECEGGD